VLAAFVVEFRTEVVPDPARQAGDTTQRCFQIVRRHVRELIELTIDT
jgi:hypothetical protein